MSKPRYWQRCKLSDNRLRKLRDSHYSCKNPGGLTVGPPGRKIGLVSKNGYAGWVTHWPDPAMVLHSFGDCWTCTLFRNESRWLSSALIREAVERTADEWGSPPPGGWLTFVDPTKVRAKATPGYCFTMAGWVVTGERTKSGLLVVRLPN